MPATLRQLLAQLDEQGVKDYRRYAAVRKYLSFKAREKNVPVCGSFELTPLCNFDCKMCYVHLQKEQMAGRTLLSVAQWQDIMKQAVDNGMLYASLTGGECLTYPGFKELYLYLRGMGVEVNILSNGWLMNEETVEFLRRNPPAVVQVTVYGASEEGYERVTGQRAFGQVMENLDRLRKAGIPLKTVVTPSAFMTDGAEVVRMLHELNLPCVINSGLQQPRGDTDRALADADLDEYVRMMRLERALKGQNYEEEREPEEIPDVGAPGMQAETPHGVLCGAGRSAFAVDWRGGMRPCNNFPCDAVSVPELGFAEAWLRTNRTARGYPRPVECEACDYREVCKNCVAEHAAGAPAGHASRAVCAWAQKMVGEGLLTIRRPQESDGKGRNGT